MKRHLLSLAAVLTLGALTMVTQAQTTVLSEDFQGYTNGAPLAAQGWGGSASNMIAVVTNDGSSLVCEFSGTAYDGQNNIGVWLGGLAVSNNISPFVADYTLNFDLAKLSGPTSQETQVEIDFPGGANLRYDVTDPTVGAGLQHFSVNMFDYVSSGGTPPTASMDSLTNVDVQVRFWHNALTSGPQVVAYQVDNISITMIPRAFMLGDKSPTGAKIGLNQTVLGSVIDLGAEVGSLDLQVDGSSVASGSYAGGSTTNTISYNTTFAEGPHNVRIDATDTLASTNATYKWDFYTQADGATNVVGFEGFESYATGVWDAVSAPDANPVLYLNGTTPQSVDIVENTATNQVMQFDFNLSNMWQVGISYDLDMNGANYSKDIDDYVMQFYMYIPDLTYVTPATFKLDIIDPDGTPVGSAYNIGSNDVGYVISSGGGVVTIPLNSGTLAGGKTKQMNASLGTWRIMFRFDNTLTSNNQPITVEVDNMVVKYAKPPFLNETWSPVGVTTNDPHISATVYDGTEEVDNMALFVDGTLVASNSYAGGSTTNTISYDFIGGLAGTHTGTVVAAAASLYAETNTWTFVIPVPPPDPSSNPTELYSINFAGSDNSAAGGLFNVADGTIAAAPSLGSNLWYNMDYSNPWYFDWLWNSIPEASGSNSLKTITYHLQNESPSKNMYVPWSWGSSHGAFSAAATNSMWATAMGGNPTEMNMEFTDLDTTAEYDFYMYFTLPDDANTNAVTTTYSIIDGYAPTPEAKLDSSLNPLLGVAGVTNWDVYAEGTNYVIITGIIPDSSGKVTLKVAGAPGGVSAIQIAKRGKPTFTVQPDITGFAMGGGKVTLQWDSELDVNYKILGKSDLTGGWTLIDSYIQGVGATTSKAVPADSDHKFYRIQVQ